METKAIDHVPDFCSQLVSLLLSFLEPAIPGGRSKNLKPLDLVFERVLIAGPEVRASAMVAIVRCWSLRELKWELTPEVDVRVLKCCRSAVLRGARLSILAPSCLQEPH